MRSPGQQCVVWILDMDQSTRFHVRYQDTQVLNGFGNGDFFVISGKGSVQEGETNNPCGC